MTATTFLSVVIIAITQMIKEIAPKHIHGFVTVFVALVVGVASSLAANALGLAPFSIAEGIVAALGAIGITTAVSKAQPTDY